MSVARQLQRRRLHGLANVGHKITMFLLSYFIYLFIIESYTKYKMDRKTETEDKKEEKRESSEYSQDTIKHTL